jgi:hypothetical protein
MDAKSGNNFSNLFIFKTMFQRMSDGRLIKIQVDPLELADTITLSSVVGGPESDPIFSASDAFGITALDIIDWDTAFGWGDHAGLYSPIVHTHSYVPYTGATADVDLGAYNLTANKLIIPASSATAGFMAQGANRLLHTTGHAHNLFLGTIAGNFTNSNVNGGNTGIGYDSLGDLTSGYYNAALGQFALQQLTSGTGNLAIGPYALSAITTTDGNVAIGSLAGQNATGNSNMFIGGAAGRHNTGDANVAIGASAFSTANGAYYNVAIGTVALAAINDGGANGNVAIGWRSGIGLTSGSYNTFLGYRAGEALTTGASSVLIGTAVGQSTDFGSNKLVIDNSDCSATTALLYGDFSANTLLINGDLSTSGDLAITTAGKGLKVKEGANAKMGTATLVAGTIVVSTTAVTANSRIFLTTQSLGTVVAPVAIGITARTAATSFTITSADVTDTSVIAWMIIEPA